MLGHFCCFLFELHLEARPRDALTGIRDALHSGPDPQRIIHDSERYITLWSPSPVYD